MSEPKRETARALVGAIRWDAWHGERGGPGKAVQRALGPTQYHDRIPFFGKIRGDDDVTIDGIDQAIMDREIDYAVRAKLGYWAYVTYNDNDAMSLALGLHLSSKRRAEMPFCLVVEVGRLASPEFCARVRRLVNEAGYLRVLGGRPVIYVGFIEDDKVEKNWGGPVGLRKLLDQLRADLTHDLGSNPYIVLMDFSVTQAAKWVRELGLDATSQYAVTGDAHGAPYTELAQKAERRWDECLAAGLNVAPIITTGWDRRPRIARPMPWETWQQPMVGIERSYGRPTREELTAHVQHALDWIAAHRAASPARLAIIYAWNENDEGGWLTPTLRADGSVDDSRIDVLSRVL